ncbi:hypothetical protein V492_08407 [Pseudogymnoascus sp. VKM F-4246]|nr:hypothetical protein V492_08407 [Pseudogymnoascus sp. VKM F-4246]
MLRYPDILKAKPLINPAELSKIYMATPMAVVNSPEFGGRRVTPYHHTIQGPAQEETYLGHSQGIGRKRLSALIDYFRAKGHGFGEEGGF